MCSVRSTSHLRSSIHLNMVNNQCIWFQTLTTTQFQVALHTLQTPLTKPHLYFSVGLSILQQIQQKLRTFLGPTTLRPVVAFYLGFSSNSAVESSEWNYLFLQNHVLQITSSSANVHASDSLGRLSCILHISTCVTNASFPMGSPRNGCLKVDS